MFHMKANSDCLIQSILILQRKGHFIFETTLVFFFFLNWNVFGNFCFNELTISSAGAKIQCSYICLYGEAPPERGIFFRPQEYERVTISLVEVYTKGREICHFGL